MIIKNISENNELFKNQNITLKDYLTKYNKRPSTLVKIDDQLIQVTKSIDEDDKTLIKLLIAVARLDFEDIDKLIADSIGKYTTDIQNPKTYLEKDM